MESADSDQPHPADVRTKRSNRWIVWLLAAVVLLLAVSTGYLWWQLKSGKDTERQLRAQTQQLTQEVNALKKAKTQSATPATSLTCNDTPTAAMKANIKDALDSKNTAAFSTYTTDPVKYVLAASELGGDKTPTEAAVALDYTHSATGPWDFNLPAATLQKYDSGFYTDYFDANTYVGKAASGMVVAFDFGCNGKISQIFVASNEDLL